MLQGSSSADCITKVQHIDFTTQYVDDMSALLNDNIEESTNTVPNHFDIVDRLFAKVNRNTNIWAQLL